MKVDNLRDILYDYEAVLKNNLESSKVSERIYVPDIEFRSYNNADASILDELTVPFDEKSI